VAERFAATGVIRFGTVDLLLERGHDGPNAGWVALARVERPVKMDEAAWIDSLFSANSCLMLFTHAAFCLTDGDTAAVLVLRVPPDHNDDPLMLSADLYGALSLCKAIAERTPGGRAESGADNAPGDPAPHDPFAGFDLQASLDAASQQMPMPASISTLIRDAAALLGRATRSAEAAASTNVLQAHGQDVGIGTDPDGNILVMATDLPALPAALLETRRNALCRTLELMLLTGISLAHGPAGYALMSRWDSRGRSAADLAAWIEHFTALAAAFRGIETSAAAEFRA